jgi:ABC-type transport system involved in multi-copper enzyme maturation permease subunit
VSFLPIVARELRAGAKQPSTFRIRRWTAFIAWVVTFCMIMFAGLVGGRGGRGQVLFTFLTSYAGLLALLAGPLLTADSLSQEKREGTLGLLFLTDLRGYDVVLGKFFARALNAFYGLLGLVPMLAITLLLGGVTASEIWRMALALVNGLFLSLAIGLAVSAMSRNSRTAMAVTVLLLLFLVAGIPFLASAARVASSPLLASFSPYFSFAFAPDSRYGSNPSGFWMSLGTSHLLGWFLLLFASCWLPRHWQDTNHLFALRRFRLPGIGDTFDRRSARLRAKLMSINPVLWLMADEPLLKGILWLIVLGWGLIFVGSSWSGLGASRWSFQSTKVISFLFKILIAIQACRFFTESRRTGALELLISTPFRTRDIIQGQWLALRRIFVPPLAVFLALSLVPAGMGIVRALMASGFSEFGPSVLTGAGHLAVTGWLTLGLAADFLAAGWAGMYLSLTSKNPRLAAVRTVLFVVILPSIATCGLDLIVDLVWIVWASAKLKQDFRVLMEKQRGLAGG